MASIKVSRTPPELKAKALTAVGSGVLLYSRTAEKGSSRKLSFWYMVLGKPDTQAGSDLYSI
jgi:hypothetical protein